MTSPSTSDDPRVVRRAAMRRATLALVIGVIALDAVAIAAWYLAGISTGSPKVRTIFTGVWMVATALVVAVLLRRVRKARYLGVR